MTDGNDPRKQRKKVTDAIIKISQSLDGIEKHHRNLTHNMRKLFKEIKIYYEDITEGELCTECGQRKDRPSVEFITVNKPRQHSLGEYVDEEGGLHYVYCPRCDGKVFETDTNTSVPVHPEDGFCWIECPSCSQVIGQGIGLLKARVIDGIKTKPNCDLQCPNCQKPLWLDKIK